MDFIQNLVQSVQGLLEHFDGVNFSFNFGSGAVGVAAYIFMALGLFTIARNRRIRNPWLAWIPVANLWLLGCISDQYRYVARGQQCSRRKKLLSLSIAEAVLATVMVTVLLAGVIVVAVMFANVRGDASVGNYAVVAGLLVLFGVLAIALAVVAIVLQIQWFYAVNDLFASCVPQRKTLFTVLSIVASCLGVDLVAAILIFLCRDKEEGMPPRISG